MQDHAAHTKLAPEVAHASLHENSKGHIGLSIVTLTVGTDLVAASDEIIHACKSKLGRLLGCELLPIHLRPDCASHVR